MPHPRILTPATAVLALVLASPADAYEPERAMANLASDFTMCSAYLFIVAKAIEPNSAETSMNYTEQAGTFRDYAIDASNEKVADARINLAAKDMLEEIDHDLRNVAILLDRHSDLCVGISNDIEGRYDYWLERED